MVKSGAVFIFATEESGIKRWTEGLAWSPSRIDGNFLVSPQSIRDITDCAACVSKHNSGRNSVLISSSSHALIPLCRRYIAR